MSTVHADINKLCSVVRYKKVKHLHTPTSMWQTMEDSLKVASVIYDDAM